MEFKETKRALNRSLAGETREGLLLITLTLWAASTSTPPPLLGTQKVLEKDTFLHLNSFKFGVKDYSHPSEAGSSPPHKYNLKFAFKVN